MTDQDHTTWETARQALLDRIIADCADRTVPVNHHSVAEALRSVSSPPRQRFQNLPPHPMSPAADRHPETTGAGTSPTGDVRGDTHSPERAHPSSLAAPPGGEH